MKLAKLKYIEGQNEESFSDIEETDNIEIMSNVEEINLSNNFLLNEALTPENIADMIEKAEVVFADDDKQINIISKTNIEEANNENNGNLQFEAHQVSRNSSEELVEKVQNFMEAEEISDQENADQDYVPSEIDDSPDSSHIDEKSSMDGDQE